MSATTPEYDFIRATIKIANPNWTQEQIEEELNNSIGLMVNINPNNPDEACSD